MGPILCLADETLAWASKGHTGVTGQFMQTKLYQFAINMQSIYIIFIVMQNLCKNICKDYAKFMQSLCNLCMQCD